MAIFYLDYENGDDVNDGSDWANAWRTITNGATAARIAPGDIIRIAKSPAPVSIGNATWTNLSKTVTLASAQTLNIDMCESLWTVANGSAITLSSYPKEGTYAMQIAAPAAPAVSTLYGYFATGELDLSAYQKLSLLVRNEVVTSSGNWKICLCSDVAGTTIVDTFQLPATPSNGKWRALNLARVGGGNLGASIQSIALYSDTVAPTASKYLRLDNFIACTTNGLNLQSLISKNSAEQGGAEGWYAIQSINGTTVKLDNDISSISSVGRGYSTSGTSPEVVTTYKRETIKTDLKPSSTVVSQEIMDSGTLGNNIEFQGGWNTSTTVQDGETFFDGSNGQGKGLATSTKSYITLNYLNWYKYYYGIYLSGGGNISIPNMSNVSNNYYGVYFSTCHHIVASAFRNLSNNYSNGIYIYNCNDTTITTITNANNNIGYGVYAMGCNGLFVDEITNANNNDDSGILFTRVAHLKRTLLVNANNNNGSGIDISTCGNAYIFITNAKNNGVSGLNCAYSNVYVNSLSTSGNTDGGVKINLGEIYLKNALIAEATEFYGAVDYSNSRIHSQNHDQGGNHKIYTDGGQIDSVATDRPGGTGIMWKLAITSANRNVDYPLDLKIAKIAVLANKLVTVNVYMKKDHATNIGGKLVCRGGQLAGVPNDVVDTKADDLNWEELEITFTPTEAGVIEIEAWAYYSAANANVYVEDMTITQAD